MLTSHNFLLIDNLQYADSASTNSPRPEAPWPRAVVIILSHFSTLPAFYVLIKNGVERQVFASLSNGSNLGGHYKRNVSTQELLF